MAAQRAKRRPSKGKGSRTVARLSALDLENFAQVQLHRYFEKLPRIEDPTDARLPRPRTHGGRSGLAPAARRFVYPAVRTRILLELERLIRRAHWQAARAAALDARARYERQQRGLGDWETSREAMQRLRDRLTDFDRRHPIPTRQGRAIGLGRDGWRLWKGETAPARETLARWARGASRRDLHAEILAGHRRVKREIRHLVARLSSRARQPGRLFGLVYLPDEHRLMLTFTDPTPTA